MNKSTAKKIATSGKVTWGEIQQTLKRAFDVGKADDRRSVVNKGLSKAHTYNTIGRGIKDYPPSQIIGPDFLEYHPATIVLRDFGEFYQGWKPEAKSKTLPPHATTEAIELPF